MQILKIADSLVIVSKELTKKFLSITLEEDMAPPFPHSGPDDWYGLMPVKINPAASEYFVYKFREHRRDITPADNVFSSAPTPFLKTEYLAERFDGDEWQVSLVGSGNVLMGVFLLRRR